MLHPSIFIAGAGFMGHGIAQTVAVAGFPVRLYDVNESALPVALERIRWSLEKFHQKKPETAPRPDLVMARITTAKSLEEASEVDFVIEAVAEKLEIKETLFRELDEVSPKETIFCSNTSAIPIRQLAFATKRPDRFCGMHFFAPVPLMALVEVIRCEHTSDATVERVTRLASEFGKEPVTVCRDEAGFIVNRLLMASIMEAARLVERGVASVADIDRAMRLGCGHKMGPLETADFSGLDVILHATEAIHKSTQDPMYEVPEILRNLVSSGELGRKTGSGFYPKAS